MAAEPDSWAGVNGSARREHRALQARAFDLIGDRYDEAFPHKEGQVAAGRWVAAGLKPGDRVLDVGCGTGLPTARQLVDAGCDVIGIDISPVMLDLARRNVPEASFVEADMADVGPRFGSFAAVVAFFSLLMLPRAELDGVLRRLHGVLEPGGRFALGMVEIDMDDVPFQFLGAPVRVTGYPREELREIVRKAGFSVLEETALSYAPATTQAPPEIQLFLSCQRDR